MRSSVAGEIIRGSPATLKVAFSSDATSMMGPHLMTVTAVGPNSSQLGFDTTIDVMLGGAPSFSVTNSGNLQGAP